MPINIYIETNSATMPERRIELDMACASQSACPLFAKLPPELRNNIYEYVFTTDGLTDKDLVTAKSRRPRSDLIYTCQRVFAEAQRIFEKARTDYWRYSTFYVKRERKVYYTCSIAQEVVDSLHDRELALIRKVTITTDYRTKRREWHLTTRSDSMKGWIATAPYLHPTKQLFLSGKRSGLFQIIDVLS
jgi:hypothetical protein